jgi:hypothetical protein
MYAHPIRDEREPHQHGEPDMRLTGSMICSPGLDLPVDIDDHDTPPVPGRVVSVYVPPSIGSSPGSSPGA